MTTSTSTTYVHIIRLVSEINITSFLVTIGFNGILHFGYECEIEFIAEFNLVLV